MKRLDMKTFKFKKFTAVAVAAVGAVLIAAGAQAGDASSRKVHYSDLNLNTPAGAKALYQRIRSTAEQVCGDVEDRQMERAKAAKACIDQAIENGVRAVNSAQLTHVAYGHGHAAGSTVTVASAR